MRLATQVYILFAALCFMCAATCSAGENGGCQERSNEYAQDGSQSRIYQGIYQYGVRVQPDLQCTAPQSVRCDSSRDDTVKENATQRDTKTVTDKNKDEKIKELRETPFLNRSRPIAWIDDYNVSTCNNIVIDIKEIVCEIR